MGPRIEKDTLLVILQRGGIMTHHVGRAGAIGLALAALFLSTPLGWVQEAPRATDAPPAQAQDAPPAISVLTRGPVHEAYAQPVDKNPQPGPVVPKKPPPPFPN